jgi:hypothetical protein
VGGCGRVADKFIVDPTAPPKSVSYLGSPLDFARGITIDPLDPILTGGRVADFSVAPPLPDGLGLDPGTGEISGTPLAEQPTTSYVITASNAFGSARFTIEIAVSDAAPIAVGYAPNPAMVTRGIALQPIVPSITGGLPTQYGVSPALPDGLSLDAHSGAISGIPKSNGPEVDVTISASNAEGSVTTTFGVRVIDQAPVVSFPDAPYTAVLGIHFNTGPALVSGGTVTGCALPTRRSSPRPASTSIREPALSMAYRLASCPRA